MTLPVRERPAAEAALRSRVDPTSQRVTAEGRRSLRIRGKQGHGGGPSVTRDACPAPHPGGRGGLRPEATGCLTPESALQCPVQPRAGLALGIPPQQPVDRTVDRGRQGSFSCGR
jgi:hypothetical protein